MGNRSRWIILALCVIYAAVRLWRLTDSCLWFDEIFSIHAAEHSWGGMFWFVAQDLIHPPLFYILLKFWIVIGGEGLLWLRLFPVLFSVLALVPFLFLCRELRLNFYSTVLAVAFLAVNGSMIKYSQTLRMYSLLLFLSLLSIWLFARYYNRGKGWIWLVFVNILLIHAHYFGWLVVGSEVLAILLCQRIKFGRVVLMLGIVTASFVPWVIAVLNPDRAELDIAQNIAWQTRPGFSEVIAFLFDLAGPFYARSSNVEPASIYFVSAPILLLGSIALAMFLTNKKSDEELAAFKLLSVFALFPFAVAFLISWVTPYSVWGARHLIITTPIALILTAIAVVNIPGRTARLGIMALIFIMTAVGFFHSLRRESPNYVWCAWEGVAKEIVEKGAPSDIPPTIYAFEQLTAYHLWFATRNYKAPAVGLIKGVDVRNNDQSYFLPRGFDDIMPVSIGEIRAEEFWVTFRTVRIGEEFLLMENFTRVGYSICPPKQSRFDTNNVFWMRVVREPSRCQAPR